jgi:hypothetical protein
MSGIKGGVIFEISLRISFCMKIDTCKISLKFEFKFKQKFLLNFLAVITFSKPALFSGDFSYKSGKTEVMI